jgi:hypothetical protein
LKAEAVDPFDRDAFLMCRPVVELVRELRPDEGVGEAIDELVALVHLSYLFWHAGGFTVRLGERLFEGLLAEPPPAGPASPPGAYYLQVPAHRLWANARGEGMPAEPLDGLFVAGHGAERTAAAVFGFHPDRAGFTVVEVGGPRPEGLVRADGSPLFGPALAGGTAANLHSVVGTEELLELVWRVEDVLGRQSLAPGLTVLA